MKRNKVPKAVNVVAKSLRENTYRQRKVESKKSTKGNPGTPPGFRRLWKDTVTATKLHCA